MKFSLAFLGAAALGGVSALPTNTDLVARGPTDIEARALSYRPDGPEKFKITDFTLTRAVKVEKKPSAITSVTFTATAQWTKSNLVIKCSAWGKDEPVDTVDPDVTYYCGKGSNFMFRYVPKHSPTHPKADKSRLVFIDLKGKGGQKQGYNTIDTLYCHGGNGEARVCQQATREQPFAGPFITLTKAAIPF